MRVPDFLRTTAFRHSLAIAAFFTASSLIVFAFVYWQTVIYASQEVDHEVSQTAYAIGKVPPFYVDRRLNRWLTEATRIERYGLLLDANGAKIAGNMEKMPPGIVFDGKPHTFLTRGLDGDADDDDEIVRGVGMKTANDRLLFVGIDTDGWEHFGNVVFRALTMGLLPILAFGCLGGALFGRATLNRLAVMDAAISRIIHGDLSERLPHGESGRLDEFDQLASRVNLMLDDLQRLILEAQVVGDTIAHDLRTPLTRVLVRLETERENARTAEQLQAVIDESTLWLKQTLGIITAVLRIGEIEHGRRRAAFRAFDAVALMREVYDLMEPLADEKDIAFALQVYCRETTITGDRELMLEALVNLVDNSIKFTPPGGHCAMSLSGSDAAVVLRVEDNGPGILEGEREAVLRRFYKAGAHRHSDGTGLGLALVAAVARLHDLDLMIADNNPGCVTELRGTRDGAQLLSQAPTGAHAEA